MNWRAAAAAWCLALGAVRLVAGAVATLAVLNLALGIYVMVWRVQWVWWMFGGELAIVIWVMIYRDIVKTWRKS
jgi:hypothetical protein